MLRVVGLAAGEDVIVADQVIVQEWQSYFIALAGASAALAGLIFVAISLHPGQILVNTLARTSALAAALGFLLGVAWSLIMLLPARTAPLGSVLLIAVGIGESAFIIFRQIQIRRTGLNVARLIVSDILLLTPIAAGIVGLLQPHSAIPYLLLAIAAGVGLFVDFSQAWTLVLHGVSRTADLQPQGSPRGAILDSPKPAQH
jgi:hypothetical protein